MCFVRSPSPAALIASTNGIDAGTSRIACAATAAAAAAMQCNIQPAAICQAFKCRVKCATFLLLHLGEAVRHGILDLVFCYLTTFQFSLQKCPPGQKVCRDRKTASE